MTWRVYLIGRNLKQHIASTLDAKELAGDPNDVGCTRRAARGNRDINIRANKPLKWRRVIDVGPGLFLDRLEHAALLACHDCMQLLINFAVFGVKATL